MQSPDIHTLNFGNRLRSVGGGLESLLLCRCAPAYISMRSMRLLDDESRTSATHILILDHRMHQPSSHSLNSCFWAQSFSFWSFPDVCHAAERSIRKSMTCRHQHQHWWPGTVVGVFWWAFHPSAWLPGRRQSALAKAATFQGRNVCVIQDRGESQGEKQSIRVWKGQEIFTAHVTVDDKWATVFWI